MAASYIVDVLPIVVNGNKIKFHVYFIAHFGSKKRKFDNIDMYF
jgi:hypothetical protein